MFAIYKSVIYINDAGAKCYKYSCLAEVPSFNEAYVKLREIIEVEISAITSIFSGGGGGSANPLPRDDCLTVTKTGGQLVDFSSSLDLNTLNVLISLASMNADHSVFIHDGTGGANTRFFLSGPESMRYQELSPFHRPP